MSRRRTPQRRPPRRQSGGSGVAAVAVAAALLVLVLVIAAHVLGVLVMLAVVGAGGFLAGRMTRGNRRPPSAGASIGPPPPVPSALGAPRRPVGDSRARRNGWAPPTSAPLLTVALSPECAGDAHVFCPGAGCGCCCGHAPAVIAAMNGARALADAEPPF